MQRKGTEEQVHRHDETIRQIRSWTDSFFKTTGLVIDDLLNCRVYEFYLKKAVLKKEFPGQYGYWHLQIITPKQKLDAEEDRQTSLYNKHTDKCQQLSNLGDRNTGLSYFLPV